LVTPLNDSLLDLDMMAQVGPENAGFAATGAYASMVLEQRRQRLARGGAGMDWILLRNRMSPLSSRNSVMIRETLEQLSKVVGCRIADGVTERVIFRQLFLCGLTVFDLPDDGDARRHAACEDIRNLLHSLRLPDPSRRLRQL
jgi:chromosome partitioning protein